MPESAALEFAPEMRQRWDWSTDDMRHCGHLVVDLIAHHLTSLPERPVFRPLPPELAERFRSAALPLTGQDPEEILAEFARDVEPYPFGNGHPRFYGWVNSPPAVIGVFAEVLAAAMNPSVAGGNHAATYAAGQRWLDGHANRSSGGSGSTSRSKPGWCWYATAMRDTFSLVPPYLRNDGNTDEVFGPPWFSEYGFQQTRGFRALKVWMSLKYHGLSGYAEAITRDIALAEYLARLVDASADLGRLATGLSIVCFRYAPPSSHGDAARLDALNKTLLETPSAAGRLFSPAPRWMACSCCGPALSILVLSQGTWNAWWRWYESWARN